jgi:hypothetical protein
MANPLTLYIPIKQDPEIQKLAQAAHDHFVELHTGELDLFVDVHYARLVLIPNPGGSGILAICMITTFDGGMNPYLKFFWNNQALQKLFAGLAAMALVPADPAVTDFTTFETFINNNNLSNRPDDLYQAYGHTVRQIKARFSASA